jgi:hypothetical protein
MEKENNVCISNLTLIHPAVTLPLWNSAIFTTTQTIDYNVYVVTLGFLNQSTVYCSQNTSMYYEALTPQSLDYYTTKYPKNPLRWEVGSLGYNSYSSDDEFWQADVCNTSKALLANSTAGTLSRLSHEDCILAYGSGNGNTKGWANLRRHERHGHPLLPKHHNPAAISIPRICLQLHS